MGLMVDVPGIVQDLVASLSYIWLVRGRWLSIT